MTSASKFRNRVAHQFSQAPQAQIGRSSFKRSHGYKTTFKADFLYPFLVEEVLPGDTWKVKTNSVVRVESMLKPIMDSLYLDTFYFFVPNRLVWSNFQRFMGEQDNPGDSIDYLLPALGDVDKTDKQAGPMSLLDYFGLPPSVRIPANTVCSLPFRAYNLIWNQWFRDQNLQESMPVPLTDGPDDWNALGYRNEESSGLLKRAKVHDYFTSALPWPQKGPGVEIPLGDVAPVLPYGFAGEASSYSEAIPMWGSKSLPVVGFAQTPGTAERDNMFLQQAGVGIHNNNDAGNGAAGEIAGSSRVLLTDLSSATAITINALRQAFQLQKFQERMARGGSRYIEIIKAHFGVTSPDARLQRSEYLGGSSKVMVFNTVPQTSGTTDTSPQANLSAFGIATGNVGGFTRSFVEHGWIIGLFNIRQDLTYQQGIDRKWLRRTREDFYWPTFAHLGEQVVQNREIFQSGVNAEDEKVFGYQERYAEYRYAQSKVTAEMRSSYAQSLDLWHLAQDFETTPKLSSDFIESSVPMARIVAVANRPPFIGDFWHDIQCVRPMPLYGTPGLVDHF